MLEEKINLLTIIEPLEAEQINFGLYHTVVTIDEVWQKVREQAPQASRADIKNAFEQLVAEGKLIEWQPGHFRSKIAETVRLLRLVRRRLWSPSRPFSEAPLIVEDIRVEFRQRYRPKRDAVPIAKAIPRHVSPQVALALQNRLDFDSVSHFQAEAIREVFECVRLKNPHNDSFMIAGDTGAGKTEAFLFPILLSIANESVELRQQPGVRAILVYPRVRLARNQLSRILRYTTRFTKAGGPRITIGIQNGYVPRDKAAIRSPKGWRSDTGGGKTWYLVDLLENCVECGEGSYWVEADDPLIEKGYPRLVCNHCYHTIDNLLVTKAGLKQNAPDLLIITHVSLSQWLTRQEYSHLWGLWQPEQWVAPRFLVLDEVHLYERLIGAHIARLIKRFQARVRLVYRQIGDPRHPIVIGVSATLHDEQRFLAKLMDVDPQDKARYGRLHVIKPEERDLEPTEGRERYIFIYPRNLSPTPERPNYRVNDQTAALQIVMAAMHNLKTESEWRGLAFFDSLNDLRQFRHNYDADPSFAGQDIPSANQDELWRIRTDREKLDDKGRPHSVPNNCGSTCQERATHATLYQCPHFQEGDCWLFAKSHGWNERLNVADSVYAGSASQLDGQDLIPSSPSLEVGYDDDAIQLIYQHKAPRGAANFIQRRGRAGRHPNDSPIIITLLWPYRRDDAFYFYHPEALYDPAFDDVPLNAGNFNVQRTHTLLAFFDLLACLRRQNVAGIANQPDIYDFTEIGKHHFHPLADVVQDFSWQDDPKQPGQKRLRIKHNQSKQLIWFSGQPIQEKWVRQNGSSLLIKGWLAIKNGLTNQALRPAYEALQKWLPEYLALSEIASDPFRTHHTYPFFALGNTLPGRLLHRFGNREWHSSNKSANNWLESYRHIDWMLEGKEEATTLTVHYPNPDYKKPGHQKESPERTLHVTFALTELLPGNVSYRLREKEAIHWTPVPRNGESTFLYPETMEYDEEGKQKGLVPISDYLPKESDIPSKPESIFGVPSYLYDQFPGLPFIRLTHLRVKKFGEPNRQYSPRWRFVPDPDNPNEGYAIETKQDVELPPNAFPISRRSSARASSIIIPYVVGGRNALQRNFSAPLNTLFGAIEGFLREGTAMLGYTRVFYGMQIDIKARDPDQSRTLHRHFYPPKPQLDERGQPKPMLVGYGIETQGIRFQLNPDILSQTFQAILSDDDLRLRYRRNFAVYQMAPYAVKWDIFIKTLLDWSEVAVDYWLQEVIPNSLSIPRLLDYEQDAKPLITYYQNHRLVRQAEVNEFKEFLTEHFFDGLNGSLQTAFQETSDFRDFVESVVLHSLSALLKNLIARLGGVGSDDLVAYTDMPLLKQVDRKSAPRILIMDTVEGGSGGIAQAFDRLVLTKEEGSLWWMLQNQMGKCSIGDGEALVKAVLSRATEEQILQVRKASSPESLEELLESLNLQEYDQDAFAMLSRTLFRETEIAGQHIKPALIMHKLFVLQKELERQVPGTLSRVATIRQAISTPNLTYIADLRNALANSGAVNELTHELGLQLLAIHNNSCDDGCPICLSGTSDIEHHYLAPLLNSRRALKKLSQVLQKPLPRGDSLTDVEEPLLSSQPVVVEAHPRQLADRLEPEIGLAIVANVDDEGQVPSSVAIAIEPQRAAKFLKGDDSWEKRWGGPEHKPYTTPGGISVRSKAEYVIATKLENADIGFEYEPRLPYRDDIGHTRFMRPDFYLYEHDLYIEYWGLDTQEYIMKRERKQKRYEELATRRNIRVLHLEPGDEKHDIFMQKILDEIGMS